MQRELHLRPGVLQVHEQVASLLDDPGLDGVLGGAEDANAAGAVLDGGQDIDLGAVEQVGGEEVQRQDPLRLGPQELRPAKAVPAGRWIDSGALEDLPDRRRRDRNAQSGELAVDPPVAPGLVVPRQPQYQRPDVAVHRGRPQRPRRDTRAHRRRTMSRCHRMIVPGVTISRIAARCWTGSVSASSASHARSVHARRE
jgi:hypothetical protein